MAAHLTENRNQPKHQRAIWIWKTCATLLWGTVILLCFIHRKEISVSEILRFTPSNPLLAAIIILLLFAFKSLTIVLYSGLLYAADGILFPLPIAVVLNLLGTAVMVSVPYLIGRKLGKNMVEQVVAKYPKAEQLRELRQDNDLFFTFLVRLIGLLPCDVVSLYMGAIGVKYNKYLSGCLLGMLPPCITLAVMGMSITYSHSPAFIISVCAEVGCMAGSSVLYFFYRKRIKNRNAASEKKGENRFENT